VHREPQLPLLVTLQLQEVVAAAERAELDAAIALLQGFETRVAQRHGELLGQPWRRPHGMHERRHGARELIQAARRHLRVAEVLGAGPQRQRDHSAADIAAHRRRQQPVPRRRDSADAHVLGDVRVGHDRHVNHVLCTAKASHRAVERRIGRARAPLSQDRRHGAASLCSSKASCGVRLRAMA
jgi:hypothetical protein